LNHALFKGLLFLAAGAVLHATGTGDIERLGGVARRLPAVSVAFLAGSVAICALPPLNGFLSEYLIYMGLLQGLRTTPMAYSVFLAACAAMLALVGAVALAAFAKVFSVAFLGEPRDTSTTYHRVPGSMQAGMIFLVAACVGIVVLAGALPQPLSVAIDSLAFGAAAQVPAIDAPIPNMTPVLWLLALFAVTIGLLLALRQRMPRGNMAGGAGRTWGCGYAFPTASMQYTGSSYAWKLLVSFRLLVRPKRRAPAIAGCFPGRHVLDTDVPDVALDRLFRPGFQGLSRAFERMWPLQHGRVQLYLVYIVVTVLVVFLSEVWRTHAAPLPPGMAAMVGETAVSSSRERSAAVP
jgi:hydrogenase-4 component B